jgi:hypothetical protein
MKHCIHLSGIRYSVFVLYELGDRHPTAIMSRCPEVENPPKTAQNVMGILGCCIAGRNSENV